MRRGLSYFGEYRDRQMIAFAGVLGIGVALAMMEIIDAYSVSRRDVSLTLATVVGAFGICVIGAMLVWRIRQEIERAKPPARRRAQQHEPWPVHVRSAVPDSNLERAIPPDVQHRSVRHLARMQRPGSSRGAHEGPGPFRRDPERYDADLRAALMQGRAFTLNVELKDGRTIAVVNQPMPGGGWVATHEDVSERERAERELESTRTFLNTIIENVPSPIIVKSMPALQYLLINRAAEKYLGVDRSAMLGKTVAEVMPPSSAQMIEAEDRKAIASARPLSATNTPCRRPATAQESSPRRD